MPGRWMGPDAGMKPRMGGAGGVGWVGMGWRRVGRDEVE